MKSCSGGSSPQEPKIHKNPPCLLEGAIIGFGNMAENGHLPGWWRTEGIRIKAVVDPRPERRERAQELAGDIHVYPQIEDLLEKEHLDFVDICTPPPSHAPLAFQCLKKNLHVLCEKPFVSTMREYKQIRALVAKRTKTAFPVHNWKYAPIIAKARESIIKGAIGNVIHSEFHTLREKPAEGLTSWRDKPEASGGGGILMDHGWHGFYILLTLNQQRPIAVTAWMQPSLIHGAAERSVNLFLEFQASTATLYLTWDASHRYNAAMIYGTKGIISIEDDKFHLICKDGNKESINFPTPLSNGSHHPEWFDGVIHEFLNEIRNPEHHGKALEEVYACLQLTLMAYASAGKGNKRVSLSVK